MSRLKQLRSGVASVFRFTRKPKSSEKTPVKSIRSSEAPSTVALTRYVTEAEGTIPVSTRTLLSRLTSKEDFLYPSERKLAIPFVSAVDALLFRKNYSELEELKKLYDVVDPEKDIVGSQSSGRKEALGKELELLQRINRILDKGKFYEIPIDSILAQHNKVRGIVLGVNTAEYEILRVWGRGLNQEPEKPLPFYKRLFIWQSKSESHRFTHVVTAAREKSGKKLWLRVYKQMPKKELLCLLPPRMAMNNLNRWLQIITIVSTPLSLGIFILMYRSQYLLAIFVTSILTQAWSVASYLHGCNQFLRQVVAIQRHNCMANNWGAIALVADMVQENVVKDVLLAYFFLLAPPNRPSDPKATYSFKQPHYHTESNLKSTIENWLDQNFNCLVKYDSEAAIKKLDELGLLIRRSDGTLSVLSVEDTVELLPKPPSPWEMKTLQDHLVETELTQN